VNVPDWIHSGCPRDKLLGAGAADLSDRELLAVLLGVGAQGSSGVELAASLLVKCGSLSALLQQSILSN